MPGLNCTEMMDIGSAQLKLVEPKLRLLAELHAPIYHVDGEVYDMSGTSSTSGILINDRRVPIL